MSLIEAASAAKAFLAAIEEAQAMAREGNVGTDIDDVLLHAKDLLDIVDEELRELDPDEYREIFSAAPILRQKLERLRDELRGGAAH